MRLSLPRTLTVSALSGVLLLTLVYLSPSAVQGAANHEGAVNPIESPAVTTASTCGISIQLPEGTSANNIDGQVHLTLPGARANDEITIDCRCNSGDTGNCTEILSGGAVSCRAYGCNQCKMTCKVNGEPVECEEVGT